MTTRKQLREDFRTLELLEELEQLQQCPLSMAIMAGDGNKASFDVSGGYTGEPTSRSTLNSIARKHFEAMIQEQIDYVKSNIIIALQDK